MKELIKKIKQKKELANVDDSVVKEKVELFLKQNKKIRESLDSKKSFTAVVKHVRAELRLIYGVYQTKPGKIKKYIQEIEKDKSIDMHKKILSLHLSSKERIGFYPEFYKDIFKITGKPNSIVDVACGLNPFSYHFIGFDVKYTAVELNKADAKLIQEYFDIMGINGRAIAADITKKKMNYKADIGFCLKIFDFIPGKIVEKIIKDLRVKYIVASFSTKTVGQRRMVYPRRGGFQRMLKRLGLSYKKIEFSNEIVYIIKN